MRRDEDRRADDREIENHRRERGNREPAIHVEHPAGERDQRDEEHVGEHDADQLPGELDLAGRASEPAREEIDEPRRREDAHDRDRQQNEREQSADLAEELPSRVVAALAAALREDRHERLRKRTLGEQAAEDIRQPERSLEGVHLQPGTEDNRLQALARETRDAREQRHRAHRRQRLQQVHRRWLRCAARDRQEDDAEGMRGRAG